MQRFLHQGLFILLSVLGFIHSTKAVALELPVQKSWYLDYDIKFYKIDLNVNDTTTFIKGNVLILSEIKASKLDTFRFELYSGLIIDSITIHNQSIRFVRNQDVVSVILPASQKQGQMLSVVIYYKGEGTNKGFFSPLASQSDNFWKISITWTLSEPLGAKYWFPCKQYLPDKVDSAWIFITVPNHCKAGANGVLSGISKIDSTHVRYEWKTRYPIAYYLLSFAVADYQDYSFYARLNDKDSLLVQNFIYNRPQYLETNKGLIDKTADFLKYYSDLFGTYPFLKEKYGHCLAPIGGGMEHQTMTTLSNFGNTLISHELAHQWFGDLVTCATWQDVWVNEGFASYCEYLVLDKLPLNESSLGWIQLAHQNALSEPHGSVYIPKEDSENEFRIFSYDLSYKKGASIIHMLRYELDNDSLFFKILREYLNDFKDSVATGKDFFTIVNRLSGQNYNWFRDQWYYGKGYPIFDITWKSQNRQLSILSNQTSSDTSVSFFKSHFSIKLHFSSGDTTIRLFQEKPLETFTIPINKEVVSLDFDPDEWLLKKVTIDKVPDMPTFDDYVQVLPNPFEDQLTVSFMTIADSDRMITIIDMKGDTILTYDARRKMVVILNTRSLPPATYLLYVKEGNKKSIRKIIKGK